MASYGLAVVAAVLGQAPNQNQLVEPSAAADAQGTVFGQHSLLKPFFAGDGVSIPNWDWFGNTVVTDDYIRLTPDRQTKKGAVWNTVPSTLWVDDPKLCTFFCWSLGNVQRLGPKSDFGQGKTLFGDGFALWYTKDRGQIGTALGNTERVNGIGILFDTYDNHQEDHGHPWVSLLYNDGTGVYNHDEDGKHLTRGGCQSFFRNLEDPTYVRVTYWADLKYLEVKMLVTEGEGWSPCFTESNLELPKGYYFGASASTGDLADNHDIVSIKIGTAPVPTQEQRDAATKGVEEAAKTIGSAAFGQREASRQHMDASKVVSNHAENFGGEAAVEPEAGPDDFDEGSAGTLMIILYLLLAAAVVGAVVYFVMNSGNAQTFDYN